MNTLKEFLTPKLKILIENGSQQQNEWASNLLESLCLTIKMMHMESQTLEEVIL